jgi:hypothetical protein
VSEKKDRYASSFLQTSRRPNVEMGTSMISMIRRVKGKKEIFPKI